MAQSGRAGRRKPRQLSGVKRTSHFGRGAAANDPKRTWRRAHSTLGFWQVRRLSYPHRQRVGVARFRHKGAQSGGMQSDF